MTDHTKDNLEKIKKHLQEVLELDQNIDYNQEEAEKHLREFLELDQDADYCKEDAMIFDNMGVIYSEMGDLEEAMKY
ncbi:hypothetical protein HWHPT5561_06410, partial [Petrotoga sp. HWH.PT.55.6.1]